MAQIETTPGTTIQLVLQLSGGEIDRFPRAFVYNTGGVSSIAQVDLAHRALGRYTGAYVAGSEGFYDVVYVVYTDAGHTLEDGVNGRVYESLRSSYFELKALGLTGENQIIDNQNS
jgi:hypothetical protein